MKYLIEMLSKVIVKAATLVFVSFFFLSASAVPIVGQMLLFAIGMHYIMSGGVKSFRFTSPYACIFTLGAFIGMLTWAQIYALEIITTIGDKL